jgi:hypothetical protein
MTCCIGKARIYYQEPLGFKLIYSGSANGEVIAPEALEHTCLPEFPPDDDRGEEGQLYDYHFTASTWDYDLRVNRGSDDTYSGVIQNIPGIVGFRTITNPHSTIYGNTTRTNINILSNGEYFASIGLNYVPTTNSGYGVTAVGVLIPVVGEPIPFPKPTYTFKVIGEETGTIYREIGGLKECPEVENLGCVMGEENYYDTLLPNQTPGGAIESSCFKKVPAANNCFHVVLETKYKPDAFSDIPHKDLRPPKIETRSQLYLCGLPGCPAEYRIECCPDGDCDPPRCPPDTDCELDCGSFVCCYKDGKVIKTVRK